MLGKPPPALRAVSLFAGIGAFDLAARQAGLEVSAAVEIDPACRAVLTRHWPGLPIHHDVREVSADDLTAAVPCDALLAGWPCQDVSKAGQRAGLQGKRTGLYCEIVRLCAALQPRWVVLENVPGLLTSGQGRDMYDVVTALATLGYGVAWRVLDAACFGLPHRRPRLFVVAHRGNLAPAQHVLPDPHRCPRAAATRQAARQATCPRPGRWPAPYGLRATDPHLSGPLGCNAKGGHRIDLDTAGAYVADARGVRRLTPREYERLMGLPDDWTRYRADGTEQRNTARYRQVGNALAVPVAAWVLKGVAEPGL